MIERKQALRRLSSADPLRTKEVSPSLAVRRFEKNWSRALWNWNAVLGQLAIFFKERIPNLQTAIHLIGDVRLTPFS